MIRWLLTWRERRRAVRRIMRQWGWSRTAARHAVNVWGFR